MPYVRWYVFGVVSMLCVSFFAAEFVAGDTRFDWVIFKIAQQLVTGKNIIVILLDFV